jgi:hypothetical protein
MAEPEMNTAPTADDDDDDDEDDEEEDCQLVSFTNKLPYYARHLCKSSNRSKPTPIPAKNREYSRRQPRSDRRLFRQSSPVE